MLFHRANAQIQNYVKYSFLHGIMPAFCRTWAQSDFFAVTSLILDSQYMHIERIVLAYIRLNHKKLPLFVLQKQSTAANFSSQFLWFTPVCITLPWWDEHWQRKRTFVRCPGGVCHNQGARNTQIKWSDCPRTQERIVFYRVSHFSWYIKLMRNQCFGFRLQCHISILCVIFRCFCKL